jgi:hypothetical protein
MTNTLATKVLLCRSGRDVVAYGLSVAPGAKLPIAQGFVGKQDLNETRIVAKREVIISAGVFQSPQLVSSSCPRNNVHFAYPSVAHGILRSCSRIFRDINSSISQLSGIGDSAQLDKFDIPSIVHLPGVGSNLQGNEIPVP